MHGRIFMGVYLIATYEDDLFRDRTIDFEKL